MTLVETGETLINTVPTMVGIDADGNEYPLCVNAHTDTQFIDNAWVEDSGGRRNDYEGAYVTVIDSNDDYVNPQILPWLVRQGASFLETFPHVYLIKQNGDRWSGVRSYSCRGGEIMQIGVEGGTDQTFICSSENTHLINCQGTGYSTTESLPTDCMVSIFKDNINGYINYCVLKAFGIPLSIVEEAETDPAFVQIGSLFGDADFNGLGFRNEKGELSVCVDSNGKCIYFDDDTDIMLAYPGNCESNPVATKQLTESGLRTVPVTVFWVTCEVTGSPERVHGMAKIRLERNGTNYDILMDTITVNDSAGEEISTGYDFDSETELDVYDYVI